MSNDSACLYIVSTPIGNLDDITLRAIEVLRRVDRVVAEDTRHSRRLLDHLGITRPMLALHEHNEDDATAGVLSLLETGETLALVSDAGTPLISDPGFPLVRACRERGFKVVPVPGVSALITALSVSGLPTDRFRFEGFLPRKQAARIAQLESLSNEPATLVFYESAHRILGALEDMVDVFGSQRTVVMARELTKLYETVKSASLNDLLAWIKTDENQRKGEFVLLLAGAETEGNNVRISTDSLLRTLLDEMPLKQAAHLAAKISGGKKNLLYQRALEISGE